MPCVKLGFVSTIVRRVPVPFAAEWNAVIPNPLSTTRRLSRESKAMPRGIVRPENKTSALRLATTVTGDANSLPNGWKVVCANPAVMANENRHTFVSSDKDIDTTTAGGAQFNLVLSLYTAGDDYDPVCRGKQLYNSGRSTMRRPGLTGVSTHKVG